MTQWFLKQLSYFLSTEIEDAKSGESPEDRRNRFIEETEDDLNREIN